jgi:pimeloyl-ACP methyl ester carboxylesterase
LGITPYQLTFMTQRAFYEPSWVKLSGDLAALAGPASSARAAVAEPAPFAGAIFCADNRFVVRSEQDWRRQWDRQKRLAPHVRTHFGWLPVSLCAGWPMPATNPQRTPRIDPSLPVLLLNGRHDPATGMEFALNVNKAIRGSVLVTYEGAGHGVYDRNECTKQVTDRYLIDGVMPARGTSCPGSDPA